MSMKESDQTTLESAFQKMLNPQIVQESSKNPEKVIEESKTKKTPTKKEIVEETSEKSEILGSRFNEIFQKVFTNPSIQEEEVEGDLEVSFEDEDEESIVDEESMVSVPEALIKELYGYISDLAGPEDSDVVDDVDFDLPEEGVSVGGQSCTGGGKPTADGGTINRNKQVGGTKIDDKTKTRGVGSTGIVADFKGDRIGKLVDLKKALGSYVQTGSKNVGAGPNKGDAPLNK